MMPAVKPQMAYFELYGSYGMRALERCIETAHADYYNAWEPEKLADEERFRQDLLTRAVSDPVPIHIQWVEFPIDATRVAGIG